MPRLLHGVLAGLALAMAVWAQTTPPPGTLPPPRVYYFAATATDTNGLTSDWSTELVWTNTPLAKRVLLAWDHPDKKAITNYTLLQGRQSRVYTNSVEAGTNLQAWIRIVPIQKTNLVLTISSSYTGWTSLALTNPGWALFLRTRSEKGGQTWAVHAEAANSVTGPWASFSAIWPDWMSATNPQVRFRYETRWQ